MDWLTWVVLATAHVTTTGEVTQKKIKVAKFKFMTSRNKK
jgi:hypothetical protein